MAITFKTIAEQEGAAWRGVVCVNNEEVFRGAPQTSAGAAIVGVPTEFAVALRSALGQQPPGQQLPD